MRMARLKCAQRGLQGRETGKLPAKEVRMPSNHASNTDYHDWLKAQGGRKGQRTALETALGDTLTWGVGRQVQIVVVPHGIGWKLKLARVSVNLPEGVEGMPKTLVKDASGLAEAIEQMQDYLNRELGKPPLAD